MMILMVIGALAETNYRVTSSTRLNVRKAPFKGAAVIGSFASGQHIEVISVVKGWATVRYGGKTGFVSVEYIEPLPKSKEQRRADDEPVQEAPRQKRPLVKHDFSQSSSKSKSKTRKPRKISPDNYLEVNTPLVMGSSMSDALNLYFAVQGGAGWSTFRWDGGSVNGTLAYSGNLLMQLYFENRISFIPRNWYAELALGYNKLGAASFDLSYVHVGICPFGYRIPLRPISVVLKAGVDLAYPLGDLEARNNSWSTDFQYGVVGGLQLEFKQCAIGCNVIYDFSEVSSYCNQTLNNLGVLGTFTYKFGKIGHKK